MAATAGKFALAKQDAAVSLPEARFEQARRNVGLFAGPLVLALVWWVPMPSLSREAHHLSAIAAFVVVWWVTEAIPMPITALVGTALTVIFGVASAQEAFAQFASPTIFVFLGAFIIGRAISEHELDLRLARSVLALPAVGKSPLRTVIGLGLLTTFISGWMNNTATAATMTPIALGVLRERGSVSIPPSSFATGLLLVVGYAATIGGMFTPVGAAPNLITIGLLENMSDIRLSFFAWMLLCVPIALTMTAVLLLSSRWLFPMDEPAPRHADPESEASSPWTRGQKNCVVVFATAVVLWVMPALIALVAPDSGLSRLVEGRLDEGVVAVLAASLCFVLPTDWSTRRFTLDWSQAAQIDWGTILMFGGGLALGRLMFTTGLAEALGRSLVTVSGADTLWTVTAMACAVAILLTELVSNTATTSMLVPVIVAICQAIQVNPVAPAVAVCLGASLSFMMPISTPPNAIVYGTRLVPVGAMMRFGILLDIVGFFVILLGLRVLCPLLGFV